MWSWKRIRERWAAASRTSSWCASEAGEDFVVKCAEVWLCGESREGHVARHARPCSPIPKAIYAPEEFHTPGRKTIAEVNEFTGLPETSQMKSLVMVADGKPVLVLLRGDHQLSETKLPRSSARSIFVRRIRKRFAKSSARIPVRSARSA